MGIFRMNHAFRTALTFLLAAMILLLGVAQIVALPASAATWARLYPEFAALQAPALVIAVAFILCVQVVLVCIWRLLRLIDGDVPFSAKSFRYIDVIIAAIVIADLLILTALILLTAAGAGNPSVLLLGSFGVVVGAGLALLVAVLRGLLAQALELQQDLAEVV